MLNPVLEDRGSWQSSGSVERCAPLVSQPRAELAMALPAPPREACRRTFGRGQVTSHTRKATLIVREHRVCTFVCLADVDVFVCIKAQSKLHKAHVTVHSGMFLEGSCVTQKVIY